VIEPAQIKAHFTYTAGFLKPKQPVEFTADDPASEGLRFEWLFGDGTRGEGRRVRHSFPDAKGTLLDGSGRFRVLLHVHSGSGEQSQQGWNSQSVVLAQAGPAPASVTVETLPTGANVFDRILHVPANGGYTFTLLTSLESTMSIDGSSVHSPKARPQVCGADGDSVQATRISVALLAGDHHVRIERTVGHENAQTPPGPVSDQPLLLWEGPGIDREPIPESFYSTVAP
jgi:hypothetical protein